MVSDPEAGKAQRSALETALAALAPVRAGEGLTALAMTANVFLLLSAYYLIKPVREELILAAPSGAEFKSYASAGSALLLFIAVPIYGRAVDAMPRNRLIALVTVFFTLCMGGFFAVGRLEWLGSLVPVELHIWSSVAESVRGALGIPFYLWVSVFSMMLVAQFWGFANDVYDEEQGKRLFPIVGLGASVGAATGSIVTSWLLKPPGWSPLPQLDVFQLILVSASLLLLTIFITQWVHVREAGPATNGEAAADDAPPEDEGRGGFALVLSHRYLILLAAFSLLFTFVNSNGEYILSKLVTAAFQAVPEDEKPGWIGAFYGEFFFYVNVVGVLLQMFAVSRIVKHGGLRIAFMVLPVLVLVSSIAVAALPLLALLRVTKTLENATDYSLNNTVRNMLWLPTTRAMKYKAKQVVDTVMVRLGDVSSGLLVFVGAGMLHLEVRAFAIINVALCVLWLWLARRIVTENATQSERHGAQ